MDNLYFEWDPDKAWQNHRKHGVAFDEGKTPFADENAILVDDPDHSALEERFYLLGMNARLNLLVVVHCYRADDDVIRLISARKANSLERLQYGARWEP